MKRKQVINYQDLIEYLNRLGIVHKDKPIGWRQQDLCAIADRLLACAKGRVFPFYVRYLCTYLLYAPDSLYFAVDGITYRLPLDMRSNTLTYKCH